MMKSEKDLTPAQILQETLSKDQNTIRETQENISTAVFEQALRTIDSTRRVYIIGLLGSAPLAGLLWRGLRMTRPDVYLVDSDSEHEIIEQMLEIGGEDAVIGISFPRYSLRTLKAMEFASSRRSQIIAITDTVHSPITLYCTATLICQSDMSSVIPSVSAAVSVITALTTAMAARHPDYVRKKTELLEKTMTEYGVFGSDEMNLYENRSDILEKKEQQ